jgi:hypothetical protein
MKDQTIDKLDDVLDCETIFVHYIKGEPGKFNRWREFSILCKNPRLKTYKVEWYRNMSNLYYDNLTIPFKRVERSGTWPNRAGLNLQFYSRDGRVCCVLPIDE